MLNRTQVAADKYRRNPTYGIRMGTQIKFLAHDPNNICHPGAPPSVSTPSLFHQVLAWRAHVRVCSGNHLFVA